MSFDLRRKSAVRAVALIEAAELIERREAERTALDVVFRRCVVAGVLGVSAARRRCSRRRSPRTLAPRPSHRSRPDPAR